MVKVCALYSSKGKFTMNDTVMDMKEHSLVMRGMYWGVKKDHFQECKAWYGGVSDAYGGQCWSPAQHADFRRDKA